jgi:hypothetical protein
VDADQDVAVSVDFQQVAEMGIEPQTSDGKGRVVFELEDFLRVTDEHHALLHQIETQFLVFGGFVF